MKDSIKTPFGNFLVKINGNQSSFLVSEIEREYENKKSIAYLVQIDLSELNIGDKIICEVENKKLEYNDGDERCNLLSVENKDIILGINGYEPQYHEVEREYHCYELYDCYSGNFEYIIERNPKKYLKKFKESHILNLSLCWINKNDYDDYDTAIFIILV